MINLQVNFVSTKTLTPLQQHTTADSLPSASSSLGATSSIIGKCEFEVKAENDTESIHSDNSKVVDMNKRSKNAPFNLVSESSF